MGTYINWVEKKSEWLIWNILLHKKCSYSELFWSVFFRIRTEYGLEYGITPNTDAFSRIRTECGSEYGITPNTDAFYVVFLTSSTDVSIRYKRYINKKFDVPWPFLSERVIHFFIFISFFTKIIRIVPWQKLSNFVSVVLEKLIVNI